MGSRPADLFISVGPGKSVSVWFLDFRDEGVVLFPVVEGEGLVGMVVLPRALCVSLDWLFVPISKLALYLCYFVKIDLEINSVKG